MKIGKIVLIVIALVIAQTQAARVVEKLDRGLIAIPKNDGVFLSWRIKGYEDQNIMFNLYKNSVKLNSNPIDGATNYFDANGATSDRYSIKSVINGVEFSAEETVNVWESNILRIPLNRPSGGENASGSYTYSPNDGSVGDLDGDGQWEIILKWDPSNSQDNSKGGYTGNVYIDAYNLEGGFLWRIDLGKNIRAGAHYTQFLVADFDSDGKAEIICKTAPGTKDASGNYISKGSATNADHSFDYRNSSGYILSGPEYLTVFGSDGLEKTTIDYVPARGDVSAWGDDYGNRVDRFLAGTAYLDGVKPSAIFQRGYYTRMVLAAFDWDGKNLTQRWVFDSNDDESSAAYSQGNHQLSVADVDGDGFDEIIQGATAIDHDGTLMYSTGLGHGDALHLSDLDPSRPGLEVMTPHEEKHTDYPGTEVHDARTGEILWQFNIDNSDVGRGIAADIDDHYGFEIWSSGTDGVYNIDGTKISSNRPSVNFRIYWDGDLRDELLDGTGDAPSSMKIESWNGDGTDRLLTTNNYGIYSGITNNSTKSNPVLVADILGDWREELIIRESSNEALLIYSTTIETEYRLYTLMHDPVYRVAIAWQNVAYNQPPHLGFYIGDGLDNIPIPDITAIGAEEDLVNYDCAGVVDGSAYLDKCNRCVAGTTGANECSDYIDLANSCTFVGTIDNNHLGYLGAGFLNIENSINGNSSITVIASSSGEYQLYLRYANGADTDRYMSIDVNKTNQIDKLTMSSQLTWDIWKYETLTLNLIEGINLIEFNSIDENGPANIDVIAFESTAISNGNCEPRDEDYTSIKINSKSGAFGTISLESLPLNCSIQVIDLNGKTRNLAINNDSKYEVQNLEAGVYIVKIKDLKTNAKYSEKIVLK